MQTHKIEELYTVFGEDKLCIIYLKLGHVYVTRYMPVITFVN